MWTQTEERNVEDVKCEFEVGMKLKIRLFAIEKDEEDPDCRNSA